MVKTTLLRRFAMLSVLALLGFLMLLLYGQFRGSTPDRLGFALGGSALVRWFALAPTRRPTGGGRVQRGLAGCARGVADRGGGRVAGRRPRPAALAEARLMVWVPRSRTDHYGDMLARLRADHRGPTHRYYLDVPLEETVARHATKPIADDVSETQLREWYRPRDLLPGGVETVIGADSTLAASVERIMRDTGLDGLPALDH
ncbi:kinase [Streptomyces sp. NPDC001750]|uniref:kinase n=1 Tax=unclassified Streptomyces TaxID=2593676 RepID=UPI0036BACE7F